MRIVTIGGFGGTASGDSHTYEGSGYLLRFACDSAEHFFDEELPAAIGQLRAFVYHLVVDMPNGLNSVRLYVSTEQRILTSSIDSLTRRLGNTSTYRHDAMHFALCDFLKAAKPSHKERLTRYLAKASAFRSQPNTVSRKRTQGSFDVLNGILMSLQWVGGVPSGATWSDANFLLAETLRGRFSSARIVRLESWAIPETAGEYQNRLEALLPRPVRFNPMRISRSHSALRSSRRKARTREMPIPVKFCTDPAGVELADQEHKILVAFHRLPLNARIRFFQSQIASHVAEKPRNLATRRR